MIKMSKNTQAWKKEKQEVTCEHCSYKWRTKSKLGYVSCPNCGKKVMNVSAQLWKKDQDSSETSG